MKNAVVISALGIAAVGSAGLLAQSPTSEEARASQCLSRLKQSALALSMYARDNDERLPPANGWNTALSRFVRTPRVFHCPNLGPSGWGYSMNWKLSRRALSEIESPRTTASLYETNVPRPNAAYDGGDVMARHRRRNASKQLEAGGNYAFVDGSAKWISATRRPNFRIFLGIGLS